MTDDYALVKLGRYVANEFSPVTFIEKVHDDRIAVHCNGEMFCLPIAAPQPPDLATPAGDVHCKDCCCARSWKALGITKYTGKSIPEHIEAQSQALRVAVDVSNGTAYRGLCEIREIYCNMEGFVPETAPEAYCLQELKRMYDTAVEHINLIAATNRPNTAPAINPQSQALRVAAGKLKDNKLEWHHNIDKKHAHEIYNEAIDEAIAQIKEMIGGVDEGK